MILSSASLVSALNATVEQLESSQLSLEASTVEQLSATFETGDFVTFAQLLDRVFADDGAGAGERAVFDFFKVLLDDAAVADMAATTFVKSLTDAGYVADAALTAFIKASADVANVEDSTTLAFDKLLKDQAFGVGDHAFLYTKKVKSETLLTADQTAISSEKPFRDAYVVMDSPSLGYGRNTEDSASFQDSLLPRITKNLSSSAATNLSADANDWVAFEITKLGTETAAVADTIVTYTDYTRAYLDAASVSDAPEHVLTKRPHETLTLSDVFDFELFSDYLYFEILTAIDVAALRLSKPRTDAAAIVDQVALHLGRTFTELLAFQDSITLDQTKPLVEAPTLSDSGLVRMQDYASYSYFSEDFVGSSRAF